MSPIQHCRTLSNGREKIQSNLNFYNFSCIIENCMRGKGECQEISVEFFWSCVEILHLTCLLHNFDNGFAMARSSLKLKVKTMYSQYYFHLVSNLNLTLQLTFYFFSCSPRCSWLENASRTEINVLLQTFEFLRNILCWRIKRKYPTPNIQHILYMN